MVSISRRGLVEPFHAMDILAAANLLAAGGADVVSMAVGQPSDPAPVAVREAAERAVRDGRVGYTDALGMMPLRAAIAAHYADHYAVDVPPSRIAVTTGSSAAFNLAFLAMFDAGDRVAIASPGYPAYRNIMAALGIQVVEVPFRGRAFLDADHLRAAHDEGALKGVLFASPANPTGSVVPDDELVRLVETAAELDIAVISDEIYHRLSYVGGDRTALSVSDDVVVINSFSKYYCMTGWRVGWMVLPERLVRSVERIQQSLYISPPAISQIAACHAFGATAELEAVKQRYARNRALLAERLPRIGLPLAAPLDGAFYAYCDVSGIGIDSMRLARRILEEAHVAVTPGRDFDVTDGGRFLRMSYAGSETDVGEAMVRLERWLGERA